MMLRAAKPAFTLIETIAAASVTTIVCALAATITMEASRIRTSAAARVEIGDEAARAIEQLLRYVREIPQDAGLTGVAQVSTADQGRVAFTGTDIRQNGATVELSLNSGTTWNAMMRDVAALELRYFDAGGTELLPVPLNAARRAAVRQISAELNVARGAETARVRSRVYLRSFMNETQ